MVLRGLKALLLGFALAVSVGVGWLALEFYHAPQRLLTLEETVLYEVPVGASLRAVAQGLAARGIIDRPWYLEALARRNALHQQIKAGEYELSPDLSYQDLLELMVSGKVLRYRLTIPEGFRFAQMVEAMAQHAQIVKTLAAEDYAQIMTRLGKPGMHPEGWFYPDTYLFSRNTTDLELLTLAHARMEAVLEAVWAQRAADLPLNSAYEALILASLVERETGAAPERALIAGVFVARLRQGMRLQTDPSVIYGLASFDGRLRRSDLRTDTPYNTYTREGLPPTPIALPGRAALEASVNPAPTDALFFVARGDGTHQFSATYREHRAAVIEYQLDGDASRYGGGR